MTDETKKTDKTKKRPGRKPMNRESIYLQAAHFGAALKDLDDRRATLLAAIPKDVRRLMELGEKLSKEQAEAAPPEPVIEAVPVAPKPAPKPNGASNGKPNGHAAQA